MCLLYRSSVTRMSVDQKQNMVHKNVDEERQKMEAMRERVEEKKVETEMMVVEEPSSSSSEDEAEEASNSDTETSKFAIISSFCDN